MSALLDAFVRAANAGPADGEGVAAALREAAARGREAWPGVECADDVFGAWLGARVAADPLVALAERVRMLRAEDLWLSCACAAGSPAALSEFERVYVPDVRAAAARLGLAADRVEELVTDVRAKLLAPDGTRPPRIAEFAGRGDLHGWVKAVATRAGLDRLRRDTGAGTHAPDARLAEEVSPGDPELDLMRERYREEFRAAFASAFASLSSRERNLLRHQFLDQMSIDEVGTLYRVHRATAARWVARARESLLEAVTKDLASRLKLDPSELQSVIGLARSGVDLSLSRLLRTAQ